MTSPRRARVGATLGALCVLALGRGAVAGEETLHDLAARDGVAQIARAIAAGVPVDVRDAEGRTALHVATAEVHLFSVMMLLAKGANPNARDRANRTPLHLAAAGDAAKEGERYQIAKVLLGKGADPTARDARGKRPYDYARIAEFKALLRPPGERR